MSIVGIQHTLLNEGQNAGFALLPGEAGEIRVKSTDTAGFES